MSTDAIPDGDVHTACQFCNSLCGLIVTRVGGQVVDLRPRTDDPVQDGGMCVKAPMMTQLATSPERVTTPLRRVGAEKGSREGRFEPISWDEALDEIATRLLALRDDGQAHTIAARTTGRMIRGTGDLVSRFFSMLGSPNNADVGPVCNDAGADALSATFGLGVFTNGYGHDGVTGVEDLGAARFILMLGSNQAETHPVTFNYVQRRRAALGAELVVVDPRRSRTAQAADEWVAIKPHTDLALALGLLGEVLAQDLVDHDFVEQWSVGFDELYAHITSHGYDAAWASNICGIPAEQIARIARTYATRRPAAIYCNAGVSHQLTAFHTYRALALLAAVTGNIGVDGAGCNFMHNTWPGPLTLPDPPSAEAHPPINQPALPRGPDSFAEAILTGDPYPIRALIGSGNPIVACANGSKNENAYRQLDFYVYTGLFLEEAAHYADLVLPVCSGLELAGVYMRRDDRAVRWQEQAADRVGTSRTDAEIWIELAWAMARQDTTRGAEYWTSAFPREWLDYATLWDTFAAHTPGMAGMTVERLRGRAEPLRWPCPSREHPGFSALYLDHPSWYDTTEELDPNHRRTRFLTATGLVEIYTPGLDAALREAGHQALPIYYGHPEVADGQPLLRHDPGWIRNPLDHAAVTHRGRLEASTSPLDDYDVARNSAFPLLGIIGRAGVVHFSTLTQWTPLGKQLTGIRLIQINIVTATELGIREGDNVLVTSPHGEIEGTAQLTNDIRSDTIYVPNSFGTEQGHGHKRPRYRPANNLVDDAMFDNLSGQQAYKCFSCRVTVDHPAS